MLFSSASDWLCSQLYASTVTLPQHPMHKRFSEFQNHSRHGGEVQNHWSCWPTNPTYPIHSHVSILTKGSLLNPPIAAIFQVLFQSQFYLYIFLYPLVIQLRCGPGSSVGIATDYGLDGLGSNPRGDESFHLSRPALGPSHLPVQCVPSLSRG